MENFQFMHKSLVLIRTIVKEMLINSLYRRIAALRGARNLNILLYMLRFLRSVRVSAKRQTLHSIYYFAAQAINQCFPKPVYGDFVFGSFSKFLVSEWFKKKYETSRLTGIVSFEPVEIVKTGKTHNR